MAPLLKRRRLIAAKVESVIGTAETLAAADAAFHVFDSVMQPQVDFEERQGQGVSMAPLPGVLGALGGTCSFYTELSTDGASASPAWADVFFPACGLVSAANIWTPSSLPPGAAGAATKTITIGSYVDGLLKRLRGCMGSCRFVFPAGKRVRCEFTFMGLWEDPSDVALLAPTWPTVPPLKFAGSTLTLGGSATPPMAELVIDQNNNIVLREDGTAAGGYHSAVIAGPRRITGSMDPESDLVANWDPYGDWGDGTEQALSLLLDGGAGNKVTIGAPKLQLTNPQEAERGDRQTDDIAFQLNRSEAGGEDELSIDFSTA